MIVSINKSDIMRVLSWAQGVCPVRSSTPALSHVRLQAKNNSVHFTATDLDMVLRCSIDASDVTEGEIIVPTRLLADVVRKMPDDRPIVLEYNEKQKRLIVRCGQAQFTLPTFSEKFLLPKTADMPHKISIALADFKYLLQRTAFAMSTNSADYVLSGICLCAQMEEDIPTLQSLSSDRRKFALANVPLPDQADTLPSIIIPRRTVLEMIKILDSIDEEIISFACSLVQIAIETPQMHFSSRLVNGTFPPYDVSVPKSSPYRLFLDTKNFLAILDRVATIYYQDATPWVEMIITPEKLTLYCESNSSGKSEESLAVTYDGPPSTLCYNVRFLLEVIQNIRADSTDILIATNPNTPLLIQGKGENALYLLMPLLRNKLINPAS